MKASQILLLSVAICGVVSLSELCCAQNSPNSLAYRPSPPPASDAEAKFTFILFSRENNANTQRMATELAASLGRWPERAEWTSINITDPARRELVERYQVGRAPMPLVLCVAPNGAVTGAMTGRVTDKQVDAALVTPTMTRCMKALQAGKIVVVHVQSDPAEPLPAGAAAFLADPAFQSRATTESYVVSDPAEARFVNDMKIDPATFSSSNVVVLAPPGVLVGKFPATATAAEIAGNLHSAGKCCDDPNCKHNKAN